MVLHIHHFTEYQYEKPVFPEQHYLSFYPIQRPYFEVLDFSLQIDPDPAGKFQLVDSSNHILHQIWYNNPISHLRIAAKMKIHTHEFNPFGFLIDEQSEFAKAHNSERFLEQLPYSVNFQQEVKKWAKDTGDPVKIVNELLQMIHSGWKYEERFEENIHDPSDCFEMRNGSCRDLSWMMIHMLRLLKIPSRFISGYSFNPELGEGHELHAWLEFFVKGAGWIGADPSSGIYTTHQYIPVSSDPDPKNTLPVVGSYRGDSESVLTTKVVISEHS